MNPFTFYTVAGVESELSSEWSRQMDVYNEIQVWFLPIWGLPVVITQSQIWIIGELPDIVFETCRAKDIPAWNDGQKQILHKQHRVGVALYLLCS